MQNKFLTNEYKGIPGITIIDSKISGKNIGIIAITHGNEPIGLRVFDYLVNIFQIGKKLKSGKLFLIANNIEAYKKQIRFIDDNMNRISNQSFKENSTEFQRFQELKPIFDEIDVVIDLHSVSKGNDIIGIADKNQAQEAKSFFDVETLLLDDLTKTGNIVSYFIRNGKVGFGLECGNHVDESGFKIGIKNIKNFLIFNGMIDGKIKQENLSLKTFEFFQEIIPQTDNFRWVKDFSGFTEIKENETYAIDGEKEVKNTYGKNIYVGIPTKNLKKGDGSGFLFKEIDSELAMITLDTKQILMMLNIGGSDYHGKSKSIPEHIDIFPGTFGLTELEFDKIYSLIK